MHSSMLRRSNSPGKDCFLRTRAKFPARNLSLRRREIACQCLIANDQVILENAEKVLLFFLLYDHLFHCDLIHGIREICIVQ